MGWRVTIGHDAAIPKQGVEVVDGLGMTLGRNPADNDRYCPADLDGPGPDGLLPRPGARDPAGQRRLAGTYRGVPASDSAAGRIDWDSVCTALIVAL